MITLIVMPFSRPAGFACLAFARELGVVSHRGVVLAVFVSGESQSVV